MPRQLVAKVGEREEENLPAEEKKIMRDAIQDELWYVTFTPEPVSIKERFTAWVVKKLTPKWGLIKEAKTVDLPFTIEEIEEQLLQRSVERRASSKSSSPNMREYSQENVMELRIPLGITVNRT